MKKHFDIVFYVPTLLGGGAERVFVNLANYFVKNNVSVTLLTSYADNGYWHLLDEKVKVIYILKTRYFSNRLMNAVHRILFSCISLCRIFTLVRPDFIFSTLDEANILSYLSSIFNRKTMRLTRQAAIFDPNKYNFFVRFLLKKSFTSSAVVFANSPDTAQSLFKFSIRRSSVQIIPNPVYDNDIVRRGGCHPERFPLSLSDNFILSVGRLEKPKNFQTLIKAFSNIAFIKEDLFLVIVGEGSERQNLLRLISELNLEDRIFLIGFVDNPYPYYKNAKAFVLSSIYEGFGNVLVEALSFGIPVVATRCSGGPVYILNDGQYGSLVPVESPVVMAQSILYEIDTDSFDKRNSRILRAKSFSIEVAGFSYLTSILKKKS